MKKILLLTFFSCFVSTIFYAQATDEPNCNCFENCENFNNNTGNWNTINAASSISSNAPMSDNTPYLRLTDGVFASWGFNSIDYAGDYSTVDHCLCWDFKIFNESNVGSTMVNPSVKLYDGTNPTTSNLIASFVSTIQVTENSEWIRICAPINLADSVLPSNSSGTWTGVSVNEWNTLISNVSGIGYFVDVAGSSTQNEVLGIDNVCICVDCSNRDITYHFEDVKGNEETTFCLNEDVFLQLDPTSFFNSDRFYIGLRGQSTNGDWNWIDGRWTDGNPSRHNLMEYFPGVTFYPNVTYEVTLAIDDEDCGWVEYKARFITECCANLSYHFEDQSDIDKTVFCMGDPVFLQVDDTAIFDTEEYLLNLRGKEDGGNWVWFGGTGWVDGSPSELSLMEHFPDVLFYPNVTYEVTLALNDRFCGAFEAVEEFSIVCCDVNSDFDLSESGSTVLAFAEPDYNSFAGVEHEYCLFTDLNGDGIPEPVECSTDSWYISSLLEEGVRYYLLHNVVTLCGSSCSSNSFCIGNGNCPDPTILNICDIIYPPECENEEVTGLTCPEPAISQLGATPYTVSWDEADAGRYEVNVTQNASECGCKGAVFGESTDARVYTADDNRITISGGSCFSYKVRVICDDGTPGPWSDPICYPACQDNDLDLNKRSVDLNLDILVFPNPFTDEINVVSKKLGKLLLSNIQGQLLVKSTVSNSTTTLSTESLKPGVYILTIIQTSGEVMSQKIIKN